MPMPHRACLTDSELFGTAIASTQDGRLVYFEDMRQPAISEEQHEPRWNPQQPKSSGPKHSGARTEPQASAPPETPGILPTA